MFIIFMYRKRALLEVLKALSSEMEPAEIRFIQLVVIKTRGKVVLLKDSTVRHLVRAL